MLPRDAEEDRRPAGGEARSVGRDEEIRRESVAMRARTARAGPASRTSSPISIRNLALKPSRPRVSITARKRRDLDRMLALVVGDPTAVPDAIAVRAATHGDSPSAHRPSRPRIDVAVAVAEDRDQRRILDALGDTGTETRPRCTIRQAKPSASNAGSHLGCRDKRREGAPAPGSGSRSAGPPVARDPPWNVPSSKTACARSIACPRVISDPPPRSPSPRSTRSNGILPQSGRRGR